MTGAETTTGDRTEGDATMTREHDDVGTRHAIRLPTDLQRRLGSFRGLVRRIKLTEAVCAAVCGVMAAYLVLFVADRLVDTPPFARVVIFAAALAACVAVPVAIQRWVWGQRTFDQVARLIERRFPSLGDELLGIIEIVRGGSAAGQSRALCEAAVAQVAERSKACDFRRAVPPARPWLWAVLAALPLAGAAVAAVMVPEAAGNAWARLAAPWRSIPRFTFARVDPLPGRVVVPHGEPVEIAVALTPDTRWRPPRATLRVAGQPPIAAELAADRYTFRVPPQIAAAPLALAVGDARHRVRLAPVHRPELEKIEAEIALPAYLQRPEHLRQDARGGALAPVKGSTVRVTATANRDLAGATVDGVAVVPEGPTIRAAERVADAESRLVLSWRDADGLEAALPLELLIAPKADEPPTVAMLDVPVTRGILLNTDTLKFKVAARDDFGIRRVGLEWQGLGDGGTSSADAGSAETGDRILQAGGGDVESLDAAATFCPDALGIQPQLIAVRAFAEDFLPGRGRVYSSPLVVYVVDRAEHALVLNTRLQQFRQQASEVRDREMNLLATNKDLRKLPSESLLSDENRRRLEAQAAAEEANARRLERLVDEGGELVREALKNPEFEAATLEQLAEDIQTLADIAETRMPSVAELLERAAAARRATGKPGEMAAGGKPGEGKPGEPSPGGAKPGEASKPGESSNPGDAPKPGDMAGKPGEGSTGAEGETPPKVGEERGSPAGGKPGEETPPEPGEAKPPVPQVVDQESSHQPPGEEPGGAKPGAGGPGRLGLPSTQAGVAPPNEQQASADEPAADEALDSAIEAQEKLLAEFAKVSEELAAVMARLEGSTFVKRLKLASREQGSIGSRIAGLAAEAFGKADRQPPKVKQALGDVREQTARETEKMSALMDDLQAYFDRRQLPAFRTVLEEMKELDTLGSLRQLSDDVVKEAGMSIAQAEFWADTFDRLADDLVPPPQGGGEGGPAGPPRESVPPEVVLEAMKILDDEVNLREETRVAQQARAAVPPEETERQARALAGRQDKLADRVLALVDRLLDEPEGERSFGPEIQLFEKVEEVMADAADILRTADTGPKAIGAETEAIELLLAAQAACSNCSKGGGGGGGGAGGMTPGGGGTGSAAASALALVGGGNRTQRAEGGEKEQATGTSGRVLPEEFRAGLDAYFNRFEKERR
jgi:hypothetical protein